MKRGEIYYADMGTYIGCEQGGQRPVLIIQNDIGNEYSPTTIVAMITATKKHRLPTHVIINKNESNLPLKSIIMLEQIKVIDKKRLREFIGILTSSKMEKVDKALAISIGLQTN